MLYKQTPPVWLHKKFASLWAAKAQQQYAVKLVFLFFSLKETENELIKLL